MREQKATGSWGVWGGGSRGQPPVSGQSPAFSVSLVDVSVLGLLQKPLLAQRMSLGFRLTENTPFAFNHLPFAAKPAYRMFCSCLTHHPSQSWDLKTKCWLWRRNSQPLTHSLGPGSAHGWKVQRDQGARRRRRGVGGGHPQRERPPGAGSPRGLLVPRHPSAKVRRAEEPRRRGGTCACVGRDFGVALVAQVTPTRRCPHGLPHWRELGSGPTAECRPDGEG